MHEFQADHQVVGLVSFVVGVGHHLELAGTGAAQRAELGFGERRGRAHLHGQGRALGGHAVRGLVGQPVGGGDLEALVPTAVFVLAAGDDGVHLFGAAHEAFLAGRLARVEQAAQGVGDAAQAEAVGRIFGPAVAQQEFAGFADDFEGALVAGEIVVVHPVVEKGVRGARLVAEVADAVAEAAADHVRPEGVKVAGVDVDRVAGHGLAQAEVAVLAGAQVLDPHAVARVPLAVVPAPAALVAPGVLFLVPGAQGIAPVEEAVPAADFHVALQPFDEAGEHAFGCGKAVGVARGKAAGGGAAGGPGRVGGDAGLVEQAGQLLDGRVCFGGPVEMDEELAGFGRTGAVGVHAFALMPGHFFGVASEAQALALGIAPGEDVDSRAA